MFSRAFHHAFQGLCLNGFTGLFEGFVYMMFKGIASVFFSFVFEMCHKSFERIFPSVSHGFSLGLLKLATRDTLQGLAICILQYIDILVLVRLLDLYQYA